MHSNLPPRRGAATAVVVGVAVLSGCSAAASTSEARDAALAFVAAEHDPARACQLLAPGTREEISADGTCVDAIKQADLPGGSTVTDVQVAGHSARVVTSDDVLFLALFDDGWKVTAAGCKTKGSDSAQPYDCDVKGG